VLWAEDDAGDRRMIRETLKEIAGHPTTEFVNDGRELLTRLASSAPRLVVLDLNMPHISGLEALRMIRGKPSDVAVVIFSTAKEGREVDACSQLGIRDYVQKPLGLAGFQEAVQRILRHAQPGPERVESA
jgi:CheY-like chemotaxis protein